MHPFLAGEHPKRLAHRGSRILWPENSLRAFQGAVDLGCRYIETDVHLSRDGHVVVFHDETLERTTDGAGKLVDWDLADLQQLDVGYHHAPEDGYPFRGQGLHVPSLAEVYSMFPDVYFNLDVKADRMEWQLWDAVVAAGAVDRTCVGSFSGPRLRRLRRISSGALATSAGPGEASAMWTACRAGRSAPSAAVAFQVPYRWRGRSLVDRRFIEACHSVGKEVHVWTVNDAEDMRVLLDMGADGIVTDRPDILNEVLASR